MSGAAASATIECPLLGRPDEMLRLSSPQFDPTGVGSLKLLLAVRCTELNRGLARALSPRSRPQCIAPLIPTRTERHALAQSRRPMGMTRYSLRSENPGMSQPSRGLVSGGEAPFQLALTSMPPTKRDPDLASWAMATIR